MAKAYYDLSWKKRRKLLQMLLSSPVLELQEIANISVWDVITIGAVIDDLINNGLFTQEDLDNLK